MEIIILQSAVNVEAEHAYIRVLRKWQKHGTEGRVNRMKRTYENCSMQRKHGEAGKDANGFCLGFGRGESDDEPCEICKKCKLYTGNEDEQNK